MSLHVCLFPELKGRANEKNLSAQLGNSGCTRVATDSDTRSHLGTLHVFPVHGWIMSPVRGGEFIVHAVGETMFVV